MFTDNSVTKSTYYIGTSKNKILFQIVLRLLKIEMEGTLRIQVIHVSGTRIIAQRTDGLSIILMMEDVMSREDML